MGRKIAKVIELKSIAFNFKGANLCKNFQKFAVYFRVFCSLFEAPQAS
jgi:hypothetical protein